MQKGIAPALPIHEWKRQRSFERLGLLGLAQGIMDILGLTGLGGLAQQLAEQQAVAQLDGLLVVWKVPVR